MSSETGSARDDSSPTGRSSTTSNMTALPENFQPGQDDVICGRGKKCYNHIGNERFRQRVLTFLDEYSRAKSKLDKSGVLSKVVYEVRQNSPRGGFVKQDSNGVWFEVGDFLAREKTSQAFRDALHERYKSSNLSKKKRRQEEQSKSHQQAYGKIVRSEYDISSRLERISTDVIGSRKSLIRARLFVFSILFVRSTFLFFSQMEWTISIALTATITRCLHAFMVSKARASNNRAVCGTRLVEHAALVRELSSHHKKECGQCPISRIRCLGRR